MEKKSKQITLFCYTLCRS